VARTILPITKSVPISNCLHLLTVGVHCVRHFFEKSVDAKSSLHYLLPPTRPDSVHRLRQHLQYIPQIHKTSRYYYSFIPFALNNYRFTDVANIAVLSLVIMPFIAASRICILICALFNFVFPLQSSTCAAILLNKTIYVAYVCIYVS